MRDLKRRVIRHIAQQETVQLSKVEPQTVLVARELLPSDLLHIDGQNITGIITEVGGETGNAAILARSLGVPAITGVADATQLAQITY